jgi:hypothetical protein
MWREDKRETVDNATKQTQRKVAGLEETIRQLRSELEERPVQVVFKNLDQEDVDAAHEAARRAYRSRDRAFLDLTRVHMLHFETAAARCRCGKSLEQCEEATIVDTSTALRGWERNHNERRRRGDPHLLPQGHPGVVDARWDPDDDDTAELDDNYPSGY